MLRVLPLKDTHPNRQLGRLHIVALDVQLEVLLKTIQLLGACQDGVLVAGYTCGTGPLLMVYGLGWAIMFGHGRSVLARGIWLYLSLAGGFHPRMFSVWEKTVLDGLSMPR